ncbi:hypothetical protein [Desulfonema magnum]|uniref:Uncharacterized protein n=1 Tax=Desulfonema magnum TaxID=45655 RepID=A0A975GNL8_9BACT|nr:hypothetical protein [Desulfonema magnum]QTA87915.1 Uncharacterized protein dnm_039550 [Desulfonema magnum]
MDTSLLRKINVSYDSAGNLNITIPESCIRNFEKPLLLKSVTRAIAASEKQRHPPGNWKYDPARDIVGICQSDVNDGSVNHDAYIYGAD